MAEQSNRISNRLSGKTKFQKANDKHLLVFYPETSQYGTLSLGASTKHIRNGSTVGSELKINLNNKNWMAVVKYIGTLTECKKEEYNLETEIRRDRGESSIGNGETFADLDEINESPASPTYTPRSKGTKRVRMFEDSDEDSEEDSRAPPLPNFGTVPGSFRQSTNEVVTSSTNAVATSSNAVATSSNAVATSSNAVATSSPLTSALRNPARNIQQNPNVNELLRELVNLNSQICVTITEVRDLLQNQQQNQQQAQPPMPPPPQPEPQVNEADYSYGDRNFLEFEKGRKPTKYALVIAKRLWGDELKHGIIEPGRTVSANVTELAGERLALLKRLLKYHYRERFTNAMWRTCRESINQAARDLRRAEREADAEV